VGLAARDAEYLSDFGKSKQVLSRWHGPRLWPK
jgi:hypothetical protein